MSDCSSSRPEVKPLEVEQLKPPAYLPGTMVSGTNEWLTRGRVIRIKYIYEVEDEDDPGETLEYEADEIEPLKLTEAEVWVDAVLRIHELIESGDFTSIFGGAQQVELDKALRHAVYQFIGGQGIKITNEMRGGDGRVQRIVNKIRKQREL
jgi:hypothetical protein